MESEIDKSKCFLCSKRVGLVGFECRCGNTYCSKHRYSFDHDCPYDYAKDHRDILTKQNNKVVADKLERI